MRRDWINPGAVEIDASYNEGNVGHVALVEAVQRAALITPVPGGVGPMLRPSPGTRATGRRRTRSSATPPLGVGGRLGDFAAGVAVAVGAGVLLGSTLADNANRGDEVALLAGGRDSEGSRQLRAALKDLRAATPPRCSGDCTRTSRRMAPKPSINELRNILPSGGSLTSAWDKTGLYERLTRGAPANLGRKSG